MPRSIGRKFRTPRAARRRHRSGQPARPGSVRLETSLNADHVVGSGNRHRRKLPRRLARLWGTRKPYDSSLISISPRASFARTGLSQLSPRGGLRISARETPRTVHPHRRRTSCTWRYDELAGGPFSRRSFQAGRLLLRRRDGRAYAARRTGSCPCCAASAKAGGRRAAPHCLEVTVRNRVTERKRRSRKGAKAWIGPKFFVIFGLLFLRI